MENQIYMLVSKLIDVFSVEKPALGQQWAEQMIASARRPKNHIKTLEESLNDIQPFRAVDAELYSKIKQRDGNLRGLRSMLHLASRISADDNVRKFIKLHNIFRTAKAKKLHDNQQQQQSKQVRLQPQPQPANHHIQQQQQPHHHSLQQHPQHPQQAAQQLHHPQQQTTHQQLTQQQQLLQVPQKTHPQLHQHQHQHLHPHQAQPTNLQPQPQPQVQPNTQQLVNQTQLHQPNPNSSILAITPAVYKNKRDRTRRSEKEKGRKNDVLYQKMKAFLSEHQFLSFDFKKIDWTQLPSIVPLSSMTVQEQEAALINDLLYVLIGTEGKYIRMQPSRDSPNKHTIGVERGGDELVYTSATRIIKICPLYSTVVHYAEDVNFGLVNQALGAPIRDLVKEYLGLISSMQLKALRDELTLQSMWLSLQTIFYRMEALKQILDQISRDSCFGGHTLSVLHNRVVNFSVDTRTHDFCLRLMQAASEPYFEILERWLYFGVIEDPFGEFFIEDNENKTDTRGLFSNNFSSNNRANSNSAQTKQNIDIDTFWRKRFTRDENKVPDFLSVKQEKIFDTGKYLSVVRHYGHKFFRPHQYEPLSYCPELRKYDEKVDEAYKFASKELLDLLLVENKLIDRLYSLKRYFLFSSGDFFVQFMDMADEELSKTKDDISMNRLESLLELALRTSSCNNDPYKDDVHIKMSDGSLYQIMANINSTYTRNDVDSSHFDYCHPSGNLLGWESLTLSYSVSWPLSMIICKDYCQTLYQMMFRHLFCCKYIERKLEATWRINRLLKFRDYEAAFALRHKMLHFVHNLLYYIIEIIEPSFQILIGKFKDGGIENVNEVIELHRAFLSGLVHDSMLTDNELLGHVTKLLLLCMDFTVVIEARFTSQALSQQQEEASKSNKKLLNVTMDAKDEGLNGSYVAAQIRKLSLTSQQNNIPNNRAKKSDQNENYNSKPNSTNVFHSRVAEIDQKFSKKIKELLNALTVRSQDFTASSKLQNIFYRLDFNNFYTSNLAS